jgi:IS30 family transposase
LVEREEISRGIAAGVTARSIAARIGRPSSTVSREIVTNGGRAAYRRWLPIRLRTGGRGVRK